MNPLMRAKMQVQGVNPTSETSQDVFLTAVSEQPFGPNGESEDNTFARWTPCATLNLTINNPDLMGKLKAGQKFYVDFTEATY